MPDGTFPNINLVQGLLTCIDGLRIDVGHLEDSNLASSVQFYSEGIAKLPTVQSLAKRIVEKWSRLFYNIKQTYESDGSDDDSNYRKFYHRLLKLKASAAGGDEASENSDEENDDEATKRHKRKNTLQSPISDHMLTAHSFTSRNAFDFIERPEKQETTFKEKKRDPTSGRARLEKILQGLKKTN